MRRRRGRIVVATLIVALGAVARPALPQTAETPSALFERANASYEGGDFEGAIGLYATLVDMGVSDPDLDYNLGNAYYKLGAVGPAILHYERARRLAPRDPDIAENLSLARALLRDRQFLEESSWLRRAVLWPHNNLSTRETFLLASFWYVVLTVVLLGLIFRRSSLLSRVYARLSILSPGRLLGLDKTQDFALAACVALLLAGVTGLSAHGKYRAETLRPDGVVLDEEVAVYSGPSDDSTLQFKIHEGTIVRIEGARARWAQVRLPGGLSGWIRSETVERI